jgi:hypothetical protein
MRIKRLPARFVVPAQPVKALKSPSGPDWVHEIKHDGYRIIVRRDGPTVRLYNRNAYDWTARLAAIAAAAEQIKAKSFTIDGEVVVLGPDGLSLFDELRRREAADTAILYAFDLIERDGEDMRNRPFLERKAALARLLRNTEQQVSIRPVRRLDQGPQSRQHRRAAGAERDLESTSPRQCAQAMTRRKGEIACGDLKRKYFGKETAAPDSWRGCSGAGDAKPPGRRSHVMSRDCATSRHRPPRCVQFDGNIARVPIKYTHWMQPVPK